MNSNDLKDVTAQSWPQAGASVAVFRGPDVLLVQRASGLRAGLWSLPGGHIEAGEQARAAAQRELFEETGVAARIDGLTDIEDVIVRNVDGRLEAHYLLAVFYGCWLSGAPRAHSDARDARFVALTQLDTYNLTPGTARLIALSAARLQQQG